MVGTSPMGGPFKIIEFEFSGITMIAQGILRCKFLQRSDDLPGSFLGPSQDLRATFGHLRVASAWPGKGFSGTFWGHFRDG